MTPSRHRLGKALGAALTHRVDALFSAENLTETILHAHLLIERALTGLISEKLAQPRILDEAQWSFHQKCSLYVGLFDPPRDVEKRLRGFNRLRNAVAHTVDVDTEAAVARFIPIEKERPDDNDVVPSTALHHVQLVAGVILMFDLGAITGWACEPIDWDNIDKVDWSSLGKSSD